MSTTLFSFQTLEEALQVRSPRAQVLPASQKTHPVSSVHACVSVCWRVWACVSMCVSVCWHVLACAGMWWHVLACVCVYWHVWAYVCACACLCAGMCGHVCVHVCVCAGMCGHVCVLVCVCAGPTLGFFRSKRRYTGRQVKALVTRHPAVIAVHLSF